MGLLLSVLVFSVGVVEALSCYDRIRSGYLPLNYHKGRQHSQAITDILTKLEENLSISSSSTNCPYNDQPPSVSLSSRSDVEISEESSCTENDITFSNEDSECDDNDSIASEDTVVLSVQNDVVDYDVSEEGTIKETDSSSNSEDIKAIISNSHREKLVDKIFTELNRSNILKSLDPDVLPGGHIVTRKSNDSKTSIEATINLAENVHIQRNHSKLQRSVSEPSFQDNVITGRLQIYANSKSVDDGLNASSFEKRNKSPSKKKVRFNLEPVKICFYKDTKLGSSSPDSEMCKQDKNMGGNSTVVLSVQNDVVDYDISEEGTVKESSTSCRNGVSKEFPTSPENLPSLNKGTTDKAFDGTSLIGCVVENKIIEVATPVKNNQVFNSNTISPSQNDETTVLTQIIEEPIKTSNNSSINSSPTAVSEKVKEAQELKREISEIFTDREDKNSVALLKNKNQANCISDDASDNTSEALILESSVNESNEKNVSDVKINGNVNVSGAELSDSSGDKKEVACDVDKSSLSTLQNEVLNEDHKSKENDNYESISNEVTPKIDVTSKNETHLPISETEEFKAIDDNSSANKTTQIDNVKNELGEAELPNLKDLTIGSKASTENDMENSVIRNDEEKECNLPNQKELISLKSNENEGKGESEEEDTTKKGTSKITRRKAVKSKLVYDRSKGSEKVRPPTSKPVKPPRRRHFKEGSGTESEEEWGVEEVSDGVETESDNEIAKANSSISDDKRKQNLADEKNAPEKAFWLIFSGEYTKAMSKDWHSSHFCCWQCDESLTGQRYVLREEHPYCIKCYESVFANSCEECSRVIGIDSKDLSYKDKHWHEACFLCSKCRVSLVDKQFGSKADKIYCGNCYDAQFASRCDGCGQIFRAGTKKMEYKTRQWHEQCFCCCVCKNAIGTKSFIPREQEIYCATCYEEKFATRCVKCNKIITSGGVTYKNEPWHRECFTCTNCSASLAGQRFTSREDKPYCADCFGELFAKRCTACTKPITGIGGTRFISFEDRHWHNDCFICAACKTSLVGRGFITDGEDIICPECAKQKLM